MANLCRDDRPLVVLRVSIAPGRHGGDATAGFDRADLLLIRWQRLLVEIEAARGKAARNTTRTRKSSLRLMARSPTFGANFPIPNRPSPNAKNCSTAFPRAPTRSAP